MPTNRPFFASFFAAFRARSSPTFQAKSSTTPSTTLAAATAQLSTSSTATSSNILSASTHTTKTKPNTETSTSSSNTQHPITIPARPILPTSPFSAAAAAAALSSHARYPTPLSRSPGATSPLSAGAFSPPGGASTPYASQTRGRQRRGSDSSNSSGGFIDALGAEKWYVGGRTAGGEERFYRLGLASSGRGNRRVGSADRLSL